MLFYDNDVINYICIVASLTQKKNIKFDISLKHLLVFEV